MIMLLEFCDRVHTAGRGSLGIKNVRGNYTEDFMFALINNVVVILPLPQDGFTTRMAIQVHAINLIELG